MIDTMAGETQLMQCMEIWGGNHPTESSVTMAGLEAWVYSKPFGQSDGGGDVYYLSSCATGRITRLLLADVSGHGQVVAQTAAELRQLMRRYVNYIDQTAFVRSMNREFTELSEDGCFATAIVSTFFAPTNDLTLCIAGHPPPLIYRIRERCWSVLHGGKAASVREGNIPLGIEDVADWIQFGVRVEVGDLVLCYTDSLIESRDASGQMLGVRGLLEIASSIDPGDGKSVVRRLLSQIETRFQGNLAGDDVTVLLFRPNGLSPTVPLRDKVLAPIRVMGGVVRSLLPGGGPAPWPELSLPAIGGAMLRVLNRGWTRRNRATSMTLPRPLADAPGSSLSR